MTRAVKRKCCVDATFVHCLLTTHRINDVTSCRCRTVFKHISQTWKPTRPLSAPKVRQKVSQKNPLGEKNYWRCASDGSRRPEFQTCRTPWGAHFVRDPEHFRKTLLGTLLGASIAKIIQQTASIEQNRRFAPHTEPTARNNALEH